MYARRFCAPKHCSCVLILFLSVRPLAHACLSPSFPPPPSHSGLVSRWAGGRADACPCAVANLEDGDKLKRVARECGVNVEFTTFPYRDARPVLEPRAGGDNDVLYAVDTLTVDSPWLFTFVLDQTRIDKLVRLRALSWLRWRGVLVYTLCEREREGGAIE